ncbi:MAG: hypothetical protein ACREPW_08630 [Candidatus Binataceae bacterium]
MTNRLLTAFAAALLLAGPVLAATPSVEHEPPSPPYKKVSTLVPLPSFLPGLGTLYVDPKTLPIGPFLAYDHHGRLVSTIYMVPLKDFDGHQSISYVKAPGGRVDHVSFVFNAGHPGVAELHYHIILWHITKAEEARVAK